MHALEKIGKEVTHGNIPRYIVRLIAAMVHLTVISDLTCKALISSVFGEAATLPRELIAGLKLGHVDMWRSVSFN